MLTMFVFGLVTAILAFGAPDLAQAQDSCKQNQLKCNNGKCVNKSLRCDYADDCSDGTDELDCIYRPCNTTEFKCNNGECIPKDLSPRCDTTPHCYDKSDEENCTAVVCQNETEFRCGSGQCVLSINRCDGNLDCKDKTDEANCTTCSYKGFKCANGECIRRGGLCNSVQDCTDGSDENKVNCPDGSTPKIWRTFWHGTSQADNKNLILMYGDEYIAVYFGTNMYKPITWPFEFVSSAWKYVQHTYGHFGQNSRLYIVLHASSILTQKPQCSQHVFVDKNVGLPNLIDCQQAERGQASTAIFETILFSLGDIVHKGAMGKLNNADRGVCGNDIKAIVVYDIYLHLRKTDPESNLTESKEPEFRKSLKSQFFLGKNCFEEWFLPIYRNHGGAPTIFQFFNVTQLGGNRTSQEEYGGYSELNEGTFIHFWSEAANIDLQPLAAKVFGWTNQFNSELIEARKSTLFSYAVNNCTLTYVDEHAEFCSEPQSSHPFSKYPTISKYWKYYEETYGPFKDHSKLSIILREHTWNPLGSNDSCITSNVTYCGETTDFFNVVDCGPLVLKDEHGLLDNVAAHMGKMALTLSQGNDGGGSWSAYSVSRWSIISILVYDLYSGLKMQNDVNRWSGKHGTEDTNLGYEPNLLNDFYLKIYNKYGKTKVLKKFIFILNKIDLQKSAERKSDLVKKQLNLGEFIHFWSSAANDDLRNLSRNSFGWNDTFQTQFVNARISKEGQGLNKYPCNKDCDEHPSPEFETIPESVQINVGVIAGIAIASFLLVVVFAAFGYKIHSDRKTIRDLSQQIRDLTTEEIDEFINGNGNIYSREANAPIQSSPFKNEYEIPRERLMIEENNLLGSGEFGVVKRGVLKGDADLGTSDIVVAVKTVKQNIEVAYFKAILVEIKIMAFLGQHENIVSLLGTVTQNIVNRKVFVALEFCAKGDLCRYLKDNRDRFLHFWKKGINFDSKETYKTENENEPTASIVTRRRSNWDEESEPYYTNASKISTLDLITWSQQIANGMAYLSSKQVIHGDLATRNVLLSENNIAKISDFGLSRQLVNYSHYKKSTTTTPLPWKWLAIESLTDMTFSVHSDIWAFGVTLWEIFNLGKVPYPGRKWDHGFMKELADGNRLDLPEFGNQEIYNLMLVCMAKVPTERISFPEINRRLDEMKIDLTSEEDIPDRDVVYYVSSD